MFRKETLCNAKGIKVYLEDSVEELPRNEEEAMEALLQGSDMEVIEQLTKQF